MKLRKGVLIISLVVIFLTTLIADNKRIIRLKSGAKAMVFPNLTTCTFDSGSTLTINGTFTIGTGTFTTINATTGNITNINAGASGTAGSFDLFPTTASKGKFSLTVNDQTGDTAVSIDVDAMGQATVFNLGDPGAAAVYLAASTLQLTLAEMDRLDGITAGTAYASKAVILGASKEINTITTAGITNLNVGADGTKGVFTVYPTTATNGSFVIDCTDQGAARTITLNLNAMGQSTTLNVADPGAAASYLMQSTAAITIAEADVLDAVTPGTAASSKAVVLGSSGEIATITTATITTGNIATVNATDLDLGLSAGGAGTLDIFPTGGTLGKLTVSATDSAGDTTTEITNASQAGARTYTIPDAGASANFMMLVASQAVAGTLTRADLTEEVLQIYGIPIYSLRQADLAAMGVSETAGDHYLSLNTDEITLFGEIANNETEVSISWFQFIIPPEYVAAGDFRVRVKHQSFGAGTDNGSTVDIAAFEQDGNGATGSDLSTTTAATAITKTSWATTDFIITAAGLVAGDIVNIKLTTTVIENASSDLQAELDGLAILLDIKG